MPLPPFLPRRRPRRHFALLDAAGRCRMLLSAREHPGEGQWHEVPHAHLGWIGQPLPDAARIR